MKIKKGKIYLCTKSLIMTKNIIMSTSGTEELTEGKLYKSDNDNCITSNSGLEWNLGWEEHLTDKVVVHCPTQADWDYVTDKLGYRHLSGRWDEYLEDSCIELDRVSYCRIGFYKEEGYHVVSIETFKELFTEELSVNKIEKNKPSTCRIKMHLNPEDIMKTYSNKTDPVVTQVTDKFKDRSAIGIEKYNTTLQDNPDGVITFLNHFQEELMDATLYIQKLKNQFDELKSKL